MIPQNEHTCKNCRHSHGHLCLRYNQFIKTLDQTRDCYERED